MIRPHKTFLLCTLYSPTEVSAAQGAKAEKHTAASVCAVPGEKAARRNDSSSSGK